MHTNDEPSQHVEGKYLESARWPTSFVQNELFWMDFGQTVDDPHRIKVAWCGRNMKAE